MRHLAITLTHFASRLCSRCMWQHRKGKIKKIILLAQLHVLLSPFLITAVRDTSLLDQPPCSRLFPPPPKFELFSFLSVNRQTPLPSTQPSTGVSRAQERLPVFFQVCSRSWGARHFQSSTPIYCSLSWQRNYQPQQLKSRKAVKLSKRSSYHGKCLETWKTSGATIHPTKRACHFSQMPSIHGRLHNIGTDGYI